ncbi:MAG: ABC transporter permease [Candidatus Wildermuthbacteria bacterium]|nr:ABC transporter permease [Candidatus Wildermuthbacteria bacterium]
MNWVRVKGLFLKNLLLLRRSWVRVFSLFFWVTIDLFIWGFLTLWLSKDIAGSEFKFDLVFLLIGALIFWDIFFKIQQAFSLPFLEEIWARNTTNLFVSPISSGEFITSLVLFSLFQVVLAIGYGMVLAFFVYNVTLWSLGFAIIPFILVMLLFGWALGLFVIALLLRFGSSFETFAWSLPFLFQPIAAVFYPLSTLPVFLQRIAAFFPLSYVFEGMRTVLLGDSFPAETIAVALLLAVFYLIAAAMFFLWMLRVARKRGYLGRFTAD